MKLINDSTGKNNDIFTKYPTLKAKQEALDKILDTLYKETSLDKWK
jgi:hypothetical protein